MADIFGKTGEGVMLRGSRMWVAGPVRPVEGQQRVPEATDAGKICWDGRGGPERLNGHQMLISESRGQSVAWNLGARV